MGVPTGVYGGLVVLGPHKPIKAKKNTHRQKLKMDQKGWSPNDTKREPKGSQSEPRKLRKHHLRNRVEKVMKRGVTSSTFWDSFLARKSIPKIIKKGSPNIMELDAKGVPKWIPNRCPNSSKFNSFGNEKRS